MIFTNELPEKTFEENHYKKQWLATESGFWEDQARSLISYFENFGVLPNDHRILDFGAGSGELTRRLEGMSYRMTSLEPMNNGYLKDQNYPFKFDAVIALEVIEHLPNVWEELEEIEKVLKPDGIIMFSTFLTNPFIDSDNAVEKFMEWWYKDDPTHISFFCNQTLSVMAEKRNYTIEIFGDKAFVIKMGVS
ncbi:MAG: class I SAM-dependent methyltransferase [Nitrospinota bacterium]